jgi:hypothetical protein
MTSNPKKVLQTEIESLLKSLKKDIQNDYRAYEEDSIPGILVTVGADLNDDGSFSWGFQTGDNSYTGGAYGFPHWAVVGLYRRSNCRALAQDAVEQITAESNFK